MKFLTLITTSALLLFGTIAARADNFTISVGYNSGYVHSQGFYSTYFQPAYCSYPTYAPTYYYPTFGAINQPYSAYAYPVYSYPVYSYPTYVAPIHNSYPHFSGSFTHRSYDGQHRRR